MEQKSYTRILLIIFLAMTSITLLVLLNQNLKAEERHLARKETPISFDSIVSALSQSERQSVYMASDGIYKMLRHAQDYEGFEAKKNTPLSDYLYHHMKSGQVYLFLSYLDVLKKTPFSRHLGNVLDRNTITFVNFGLLMDRIRKSASPHKTEKTVVL